MMNNSIDYERGSFDDNELWKSRVQKCIDKIKIIPIMGRYESRIITPNIMKEKCIEIIQETLGEG